MTPTVRTPGPATPPHRPGVRPALLTLCACAALSLPLSLAPTTNRPVVLQAHPNPATSVVGPRSAPSAASRSHSRPVLPTPTTRINVRRHTERVTRTGHYPADRASVERTIRAAASSAAVSPSGMVALAWCESRLNPLSRSRTGAFVGAFQHAARYWPARAARYGRAGASPYQIEPAAWVSAMMVRDGQLGAWACAGAYRRAA